MTRRPVDKFVLAVKAFQSYRNWHTFFLDYFGILRSRGVIYRLRNCVKLKGRAGRRDCDIINGIWVRKEYTATGDEIRDGDVVLDIGAHIGAFSVLAATCAKGVRVYSYEPLPDNFNLLEDNMALSGLTNVKVFRMAVAGRAGSRPLSVDKSPAGSSLVPHPSGPHIFVECLSLAEVFQINSIEDCGFLKMDCEGAEYEILSSTPAEVFSRIRRVSLEYHLDAAGAKHDADGRELVTLLESHGFQAVSTPFVSHRVRYGYIQARNRRYLEASSLAATT